MTHQNHRLTRLTALHRRQERLTRLTSRCVRARQDRLTRLTRLTSTLAIALFCHLYAAAASAAPLVDLEGKLGEFTEKLTTYGRGLTLLAVVIVFLSWICEPALPSWARENKGLLGRVIIGAIGVGLAPDIVSFVFG